MIFCWCNFFWMQLWSHQPSPWTISRRATTLHTRWLVSPSKSSTPKLRLATLSSINLILPSLKSPPRSTLSCGQASNTEILTRDKTLMSPLTEAHLTTLTLRSWRDFVRESITSRLLTSRNTRTPLTAEEFSPTPNFQVVEHRDEAGWEEPHARLCYHGCKENWKWQQKKANRRWGGCQPLINMLSITHNWTTHYFGRSKSSLIKRSFHQTRYI